MHPREAAAILEKLTPAEFKLRMTQLLEWQMRKDKTVVVNLGWYLKCLQQPALKPGVTLDQLRALTKTIGRTV